MKHLFKIHNRYLKSQFIKIKHLFHFQMFTSTPNETPIMSPNDKQPFAEKLEVAKARRRLFVRNHKIRKALLPYTKRLTFSPDSSSVTEVGSPRRLRLSGDKSSPVKIVDKTIDLESTEELADKLNVDEWQVALDLALFSTVPPFVLPSPKNDVEKEATRVRSTPATADALPTEVWDIISQNSKTAWHVVVNTTYTILPSDNVLK